jgi:urease accessory protein
MGLPLLMLTDGRFPAGGYAHSGGLEAAVADGLDGDGVAAFLVDRLTAVAGPEAMLVVSAARAARTGDLDALLRLDLEADARCPSPPLRAASHRLGAQLLRTAAAVWPERALVARYGAFSSATPRPVAFGVVAAGIGLDDRAAAQAYLYEEAATVAAAAVRLLPVDTATAFRRVADAAGAIEELAERAARHEAQPRELPSAFAPALELRSLAHARREGRLFAT